MFKKRVFVKPANTSKWCEWIVIEQGLVANFIDDWKRYGIRIALGNTWYLIWNKRGIYEEIKKEGGT